MSPYLCNAPSIDAGAVGAPLEVFGRWGPVVELSEAAAGAGFEGDSHHRFCSELLRPGWPAQETTTDSCFPTPSFDAFCSQNHCKVNFPKLLLPGIWSQQS